MQLSVTQTITSTENNYKANVNFGGGECSYRSLQSQKIGAIPKTTNKQTNKTKKKITKPTYEMKASSLTLREREDLKISYKHSLQR